MQRPRIDPASGAGGGFHEAMVALHGSGDLRDRGGLRRGGGDERDGAEHGRCARPPRGPRRGEGARQGRLPLRDGELFAAIFRSAEAITLTIEPTPKGVRVIETSRDPAVVLLIQAHAAVVSAFLEKGHAEMRRDHPVPAPAP
jgi:hypothetical protein